MRRPSPAMVVAMIALCVALAGGAYAAINLPKGSVGTKQLKNGAVTPPKVSASTLEQLTGETGPPGPPGPQGEPGGIGPTGPPGPGAKLLVTEPFASASGEYVQLGQVGPFTLHTRCRISAGNVAVEVIATGAAALTVDTASIGENPSGTVVNTDFETSASTTASPMVISNGTAVAGGNVRNVWNRSLLQAESSVSIESWLRAETAGGPLTDSCRISVIVTPLE